MNRRNALRALPLISAAPLAAFAQSERRVRRIGYLSLASAQISGPWLAAFRAGMLELRWVDGRDYVIDVRHADGVTQAAQGLVDELLKARPDLLMMPGDQIARMFSERTKTIPIVFAAGQDPVGNGVAASLRSPGGNVTGLSTLAGELSAKRLQLLKEAFPRIAHVALLFEPGNMGSVAQAKEALAAAPRLGIRVTPIELRQPADIDPAFRQATAVGAQAFMVTQGGTTTSQRQAIVERIIRLKAPSMFAGSLFVEAGGLMSYAASFTDNFRRAAAYVDKIFNGARPGDLPIERPLKFEMVVNMHTARAIGVTFTSAFMVGVDRLIE